MKSSSYDSIANEYYDKRHITSRNFDEATSAFCSNYNFRIPSSGLILEIGCGRGTTSKYCGISYTRIVQTDISARMLMLTPREKCLLKFKSNALKLPFLNSEFSGVTAFLYDPYNKTVLYKEIQRALKPGGVFMGTLPHIKWGMSIRNILGYDINKSRFVTKDGSIIELDSFLMDDNEIENSMEKAGLTVTEMHDLYLPGNTIKVSKDISIPASSLGLSVYSLPIIKLVIAKKSK